MVYFFLTILTAKKTILHAYILGCLFIHVGIVISHTRSHSNFFM